jgi:transketolase C-terminal domain/subunit
MNRHKVVVADDLMEQELALQVRQREARVADFAEFYGRLNGDGATRERLQEIAGQMHLRISDSSGKLYAAHVIGPVLTKRAAPRSKRIEYDAPKLPRIDPKKEYASSDIVTAAMKVFARDPNVVSIDADLATTSGLEAGIGSVDQRRALNAGVAEANMMNIGEAFAVLGCNTWVSTFCPFFDWKVLRRIAVGHQERLESIAAHGWLSEGHGLDLTFLATGPDFETRTNGATHMGNDDITIFDGMGHLKIINVSCPRQLLAVMRWIMEGNRGLVYVRVMRAPSKVLYGEDYSFEFGKSHALRSASGDAAVIITSGRAVHEALAASEMCAQRNLSVGVVDMPSVDEDALVSLYESGKLLLFGEQNNGFLWQSFVKAAARRGQPFGNMDRVRTVNTLDGEGRPFFIHSGTYEQLLDAFQLSPGQIADFLLKNLR